MYFGTHHPFGELLKKEKGVLAFVRLPVVISSHCVAR